MDMYQRVTNDMDHAMYQINNLLAQYRQCIDLRSKDTVFGLIKLWQQQLEALAATRMDLLKSLTGNHKKHAQLCTSYPCISATPAMHHAPCMLNTPPCAGLGRSELH